MRRLKNHRFAHRKEADIDVTPFMNLMMVMVATLLLTTVFTKITVLDLDFPSSNGSADVDVEQIHLEVTVHPDALVVADGRGGVIKTLPLVEGRQDYAGLSLVMQELKRRAPDKRDIVVLLDSNIDYQTVVSVMDHVRSYPTVVAMQVVEAELFPQISLGDPPPKST